MVSLTQPGEFKKKINIDYLHSMYTDHQQCVEELALREIHSLELAMPKFNTLTTLSRQEFNKMLMAMKHTFKNPRVYTIMAVVLADTLTCMVKNSHFHDCCPDYFKSSLDLLLNLLSNLATVIRFGDVMDHKQLETLITILERSAKRIEANGCHERMTSILQSLKHQIKFQSDKENKINIENEVKTEMNPHPCVRDDIFKQPLEENFKPTVVMTKKRKVEKSSIDTNVIINGDGKKTKKEQNLLTDSKSNMITNSSSEELVTGKSACKSTMISASVHAVHLKPQKGEKITNAFEFMMMSSKLRAKKK